MEKLAIFDVDYTLTSKETLRQFYYFLLTKKPRNIIYMPRVIISGILFITGIYDEKRTKEMFLKFMDTMTEEEISTLVKEFYNKKLKSILYKDGIDMLKDLKSKGYLVYLISASPEFYLKEMYDIKEVDKILGTRFKKISGKYTRFMEGANCKGEEKVRRLKESLSHDNIEVDFKNSYMFSDSLSDLPLLNLVGNPYLINYKKKYPGINILRWK